MAAKPALLNLVPDCYQPSASDKHIFDEQHNDFGRAKVVQRIYIFGKPESRESR
jgi:hypothetical protein